MDQQKSEITPDLFSRSLFEKMQRITPVIKTMEYYEFRYCLNSITPENDNWQDVTLLSKAYIEDQIQDPEFFKSVEIKRKVDGKIILDSTLVATTRILFKDWFQVLMNLNG